MVLAGMCPDPWVIAGGPNGPDVALLWEDTVGQYKTVFGASSSVDMSANVEIPNWWKDPANRDKIAHTVHTAGNNDWTDALGLAVERNVGHLFLLDTGGPYNHLPPYWWTATDWMNSYNTHSVGLSDELLLRAAHLWGDGLGKVHAWPNGEQAWYAPGQVRGTFTLDGPTSDDIVKQTIALPDNPPLYNVSKVWAAAHAWAVEQGKRTAWPTFVDVGAGQYEVITFSTNVPWLKVGTVSGTYQQPTFAEPYALIRNVHRVAAANGHVTALPTFRSDNFQGTQFQGQIGAYEVVFVENGAPITWQDVPGNMYGRMV